MRARGVPLLPSAVRGSPASSGDSGDTGRGAGWRAAGRGVGPAPERAPGGSLGRSLKPLRARKFAPEQAQGEVRGAPVQPREPSGLDSAPFSPLVPSLCPFGPGKGDTTSGAPAPGPRRSPSGSAGGAVAHRAGDPRVMRCESSPRSSLRPPETLEHPNNAGVSLDSRTRLSPRCPPMGTFEH